MPDRFHLRHYYRYCHYCYFRSPGRFLWPIGIETQGPIPTRVISFRTVSTGPSI